MIWFSRRVRWTAVGLRMRLENLQGANFFALSEYIRARAAVSSRLQEDRHLGVAVVLAGIAALASYADHSERNAVHASVRAALRAGTRAADAATTVTTVSTPARIAGCQGVTP